jgi:hypothetical protein
MQNVFGSRSFLLDRIASFADQPSEYVNTLQQLTEAKKCLTGAMWRLFIVAKHTRQFGQQPMVYEDEETRYTHRFRRFAMLQSPPHTTYASYIQRIHVNNLDVEYTKQVIWDDLARAKHVLENTVILTAKETNTEMCHGEFVKV